MSWPMPNSGPWNPGVMPVGPDLSMGSLNADQWTAIQQQNWQQWTQWQQQYAQWQSQYSQKYPDHMPSLAGMPPILAPMPGMPHVTGVPPSSEMSTLSGMPPLPPTNTVPPPAPPPPDHPPPPPPPHENNQPLYSHCHNQSSSGSAPPTDEHRKSNNLTNVTTLINSFNKSNETLANSEALKKLAEEERLFDVQFQKWEEEIKKWKQENINHPDKNAYKEYEEKFEACRLQLLERRKQMNQKRARLLAPQVSQTTITGNTSAAPTLQNSNSSFSKIQQAMSKSNLNYTSSPVTHTEVSQNTNYKKVESQDNYDSCQGNENRPMDNTSCSEFFTSTTLNKVIPGLDLVPEVDNTIRTKTSHEIIDITNDKHEVQKKDTSNRPDYSNITKGINNILGDEKIMNILSMVHGQNTLLPNNNKSDMFKSNSNTYYNNAQNNPNQPWMEQSGNIQNEETPYNQNDTNYKINSDRDQYQKYPPQRGMYDSQEKQTDYYDNNSQFSQNMPQYDALPSRQFDNSSDQQNNSRPLTNNTLQPLVQNMRGPQNMHGQLNMRESLNIQGQLNTIGPLHMQSQQNMRGQLNMQSQQNMRGPQNMQGHQNLGGPQNIQSLQNMRGPASIQNYHNFGGHQNIQNSQNMRGPPNIQGQQNISSQNMRGSLNVQSEQYMHDQHNMRGPKNISDQQNKLSWPDQPNILEQQDILRQPITNDYNKGSIDSRDMNIIDSHNVIENPKPKWVEEHLFAPSIIVEYEHKPLRLKARDFIEPVHMFDYAHKSKDEDIKKKDFETEMEGLFTRKRSRNDISEEPFEFDKYNRDYYSHDHDRIPRDDFRDSNRQRPRDDGRHRTDKRYDSRRREDPVIYNRRDGVENYGRSDNIEGYSRRDDDGYRRRDDYYRDKERYKDHRRDEYRRSRSRDKDSRKRARSVESQVSNSSVKSKKPKEEPVMTVNKSKPVVMIDDILEPPGRDIRPSKIVIILRGPPGSGKSYLAKLIRDREAEHGGTVRIMSIDDYFMQEGEIEEKDPATGKIVKKPSLKYEYDEQLEETYISSLKRAFRRSLTDGYFSFLIFDAVNDQLKSYADIWNYARQNGFQVYICTMELNAQICHKRNIHNRKLEDIEVISARFFPTPNHHIQLDPTTLLQSAAITEVDMEDVTDDFVNTDEKEPEVDSVYTSKWEKMEDAAQLARLDGISKPLRPSQLTMEDYLQLDDWKPNASKPGKKTVRWADIEERRNQEKMRAIGFVVGQTDWNRMTDPTLGSSALTQTKYIERVRRN